MKFGSLLLFSENPEELASFYKKVFEKDPQWEEGGYSGFQLGQGMFIVGPHDKVKGKNNMPERMLVNFETEDVAGEFKRIKDLGAKVVKEPYDPAEKGDMSIATFADPDGNFFQLTSPMK